MKANLTIDAPLTLQLIESYLKDLVETEKSNGLLLALVVGSILPC